MRFQLISDTHHDVAPVTGQLKLADGVDTLLVAGDVCEGAGKGFAWLRDRFGPVVRIVCIAGNHTFYRTELPAELVAARAEAQAYDVVFLENDILELPGLRILGCTLWTDYELFQDGFREVAMREAASVLNDHRRIIWSKQPFRKFRPLEALSLHIQSRAFLASALAQPFAGKTIVMTHHAPSWLSIAPPFRNKLSSAAYASRLEPLMLAHNPVLWVHGHVHTSLDYAIGDTRVLCNPHGYGTENPDFNPALVMDL